MAKKITMPGFGGVASLVMQGLESIGQEYQEWDSRERLTLEDWQKITASPQWAAMDKMHEKMIDGQLFDAKKTRGILRRHFWANVIEKDPRYNKGSEDDKNTFYRAFFNMEDYSEEDVAFMRTNELPIPWYTKPREFIKGLAGATQMVPETMFRTAQMLSDITGHEKAANWWKEGVSINTSPERMRALGIMPSMESAGEKWAYMIGQGAGSGVVSYGMAPLGTAAPAILFGMHAGTDQYAAAREKGLTPAESFAVFLPAFATEALLEKAGLDFVFKGVGGSARRAITGVFTEAAQEFSQETSQNVIRMIYDPETRTVGAAFQGSWEAAIIGGIVGGPAGGAVDFHIARAATSIVKNQLDIDPSSDEGKRWTKIVRDNLYAETASMNKQLKEEQKRLGIVSDPEIDEAAEAEEMTPEREAMAEALWMMINDPRLTKEQRKRLVQEPLTPELLASIDEDWQDDFNTMIGKLAEDLKAGKAPDLEEGIRKMRAGKVGVGVWVDVGPRGRTQRPVVPGGEQVKRSAASLTGLSARTGIPEAEIAKLRKADQVRMLNDPSYAQDMSAQWSAQGRLVPEKPPATIEVPLSKVSDRPVVPEGTETVPLSDVLAKQTPEMKALLAKKAAGAEKPSAPPQETEQPPTPTESKEAPKPVAPPAEAVEETKKAQPAPEKLTPLQGAQRDFDAAVTVVNKLHTQIEKAGETEKLAKQLEDATNVADGLRRKYVGLAKVAKEAPPVKAAKEKPVKPVKQQVPKEQQGRKQGLVLAQKTKAGSEKVPARYALVELSDLLPSNNPKKGFVPSEGYPDTIQARDYQGSKEEQSKVIMGTQKLNPDQLLSDTPTAADGPPIVAADGKTVINGNARSMMLVLSPGAKKYGAYKKALMSQLGKLGLDEGVAKGMKQPVVVRSTDLDPGSTETAEIARILDVSMTAAMSPVRKAAAMAEIIPDEFLDTLRTQGTTLGEMLGDRRVTAGFLPALSKHLASTERSTYITEGGGLTEAGKTLMRDMLLAKVFPVELIEQMEPSTKRAFDSAVPQLIEMQKAGFPEGFNIVNDIHEAIELFEGPLKHGSVSIKDYVDQGVLFGEKPEVSDQVRDLLTFVGHAVEKPSLTSKRLRRYISLAKEETGMFAVGADVKQTVKDALTTDKAAPTLFDEAQEKRKEEREPSKAPGRAAAGAAAVGAGYGKVGYSDSEGPKKAGSSKRMEAKRPQPPTPSVFHAAADKIIKVAAPSARSEMSREAAGVIRGELGKLAQKKVASYKVLEEAVRYFTFKSREEVEGFIDRMEMGERQETVPEDAIAKKLREILDNRREEVQGLGKGFLQQFYENYFPHMWKDPAAAKTLIGKILGKRPLSGPKSFLKKRTLMTFKEGIEAGLEPVTDNPVEMVLLKVYEMDRLIMAQKVIASLKERNLIQFVYARAKAPDGFRQLKDYAFQVFMPPEMTVQESYDQILVDSLMSFAESIGISHKRLMRLRGRALGWAQKPKTIRTKFASPVSVMAHEIGHVLGYQYDLYNVLRWKSHGVYKETMKGKNKGQKRFVPTRDAIDHRKVIDEEWRALADARFEQVGVSESYKKYVRKSAEKEAVLLEALIHAPKKMQELAPNLTAAFKGFINSHSELRPLLDIQPSLVLGEGTGKIKIPGITKLGEYYAPEHVATLINNHLSPGLQRNALYNALRYTGNILNQVQLGFSLFHGINTGLDAVGGQVGLGLRKVLAIQDQKASGFIDIITAPVAPFVNLWTGGKFMKDYAQSLDQITDPELRGLVERFAKSGGRTGLDPFYYNQGADNIRKNIQRVIRGVGIEKVKGAARLPLDTISAVVETIAAPLMRYWVPRQKIGAWLKMAESEMKRAQTVGFKTGITEEQLGEMLRRTWDSVDNRMGQLVYDNIFWNKTLKDSLMLAIRSVGWNLGSWREYAGAVTDVVRTKQRIAAGDVWLSNKIGYAVGVSFTYVVIGAVLHYLLTGERPEELKDYFFPKTGNKNPDGSDERLSLPTYARDWWAYSTRPVETVANKMHPMISMLSELWHNKDFFGTEIVGADDPIMEKLIQWGEHVGKQFRPISVHSYLRLRRTGGSTAKNLAAAISGITPAGRYLTRSPAQMLMYKHIVDQLQRGAREKEEGERQEAKKDIVESLRHGDDIDKRNMISMSYAEWRQLLRRAKIDPLVGSFGRLRFDRAVNVYLVATPEEKAKLRGALRKRARSANKYAYWFSDAKELYKEILKQERK